jgi:hypothetical protein
MLGDCCAASILALPAAAREVCSTVKLVFSSRANRGAAAQAYEKKPGA